MIPAQFKEEWDNWNLEGYDERYGRCATPAQVVRYPSSYGHLRPDNLPYYNNNAFIPEALLPALRKESALPDWFWDGDTSRGEPVVVVYCDHPGFEDGVLGFSKIEPWVPMAFVPLASRERDHQS